MNAEISETMGARLLRFGVQIPELLTQRKFVSVEWHAHSNAHKPPKKKVMTSEPDNAKCFYAFMCVYVNSCRPNLAAKKKALPALRESKVRG